MSARAELFLLLMAWVAIFGLFVVLPWIVVRAVVYLLEADVRRLAGERRSTVPGRPKTQTSMTRSEDDGDHSDEPEPPGSGPI